MHVLIFAGMMCICLPKYIFVIWLMSEIALNAQVCFQYKKLARETIKSYFGLI